MAVDGDALTVGIVAYRRPDALRNVLGALDGHTLDVVVANVGRDPAIADVVANADGARLLDLDNHGYAAAVNAIARVAYGDVVIFANDDARFDVDVAQRLAAVVRAGEADAAVPRVMTDDGEVEPTIAAVPSLVALAREWLLLPDRPIPSVGARVRVEKWRAPKAPERIGAASAVVVAVGTALLLEEPMPEAYFLYWEESEWFWRLRNRGAVVQYRPDIVCVHSGGRADVRPEKSRLMARNAVRCIRRTQGRVAALAALVIVVAWNLRLVAVDLVRAVVHPTSSQWARLGARWSGLSAAATSWGELR